MAGDTEVYDMCPALSLDWPAPGSKLYFVRCDLVCSQTDIYEATWHPAIPSSAATPTPVTPSTSPTPSSP